MFRAITLPSPALRAALLWVAAAVACAVLIWNVRDAIARSAVELWSISDGLAPADAVAVLGGGSTRPYSAAELYRRGLAHRVLYDLDADRAVLLSLNVPPQDIEEFGAGLRNTYEESCALVAWARTHGARRIIVPTEIFPSRRVKWIFDHQFGGSGVNVIIDTLAIPKDAAANGRLSAAAWTQFRTEMIKYLFYRVRYAVDYC